MFTDRPGTGGMELNPRVKQATKELSLAYLRSVFGQALGDDAMVQWAARHKPILARYQYAA
jgi:hypothetical protein